MDPRPKSWLTIIATALREGGFTRQDKAEAADWATCAVGEMRSTRTEYVRLGGIETPGYSMPEAGYVTKDTSVEDIERLAAPYWWLSLSHRGPAYRTNDAAESRIADLGIEFMRAVNADNPERALRIYSEISELWPDVRPDSPVRSKVPPAQ